MSLIRSLSSNSINYILRLIVYYIYSITCDECIRISNNAVYSEPQLNLLIQIRNATLIDISSPIIVINISKHLDNLSPVIVILNNIFLFSTKSKNNRSFIYLYR